MGLQASTLLLVAGVVAGAIGAAGGITSLVSYPALLLAGLSPLTANVVNLVAVIACWPGSALSSRRELAGTGRWLAAALPAAALGALSGSVLLLLTPGAAFDRLAPWLVLTGSAALLAQPHLAGLLDQERAQRPERVTATLAAIAAISVYSGYFGAGSGVLLLALLLTAHDRRLPVANAKKNMLVGASALASALLFAPTELVIWTAVVPLAIGEFIGSLLGPAVTRALPAGVVRFAVAALGVVLAVELLLSRQ